MSSIWTAPIGLLAFLESEIVFLSQKDFDLEQEMQLEHPYRVELEHFQVPQRQLESAEPIVNFFIFFG